jgi:ABC-type multidrug transport system ATPase subunit
MVTVQAAIEVRAIGQRTRFRGVTLRDISLTVGYGELVAIIGGSGSGKTVLLDVMAGLRPPSSGTVRRERENIGYVPDADTLHAVLPLGRALRYTAAVRGVRLGDSEIDDVLRAAGLAASATVPVAELDPGERKRAAIAAELLARPAFLFLEEPTAALDPAQGAEVMRMLRRRCDEGTTVVFTTHSPPDAVKCDKVAVLAAGGHLAFFGTTNAACGYFGADSLDEICERLAGLGDPAAAWSRRFFHFSQASRGFLGAPSVPPQPGPANLVPDFAGPHSAGRPEARELEEPAEDAAAREPSRVPSARGNDRGMTAPELRPVRQLGTLVARNAELLGRDHRALAVLAAAPLAVLLALAVLLPAGALGPAHASAACMAWTALGVVAVGLAYGLPQVRSEVGVVRAERFAGLSSASYVLAKLVVLMPIIAAGDALILVLPALSARLPSGGYGTAFVLLLLSSAVALALALLLSASFTAAFSAVPAALAIPLLLLAAALLATLVTLARPAWADMLVLAVLAAGLLIATTTLIARGTSPAPGTRRGGRP